MQYRLRHSYFLWIFFIESSVVHKAPHDNAWLFYLVVERTVELLTQIEASPAGEAFYAR